GICGERLGQYLREHLVVHVLERDVAGLYDPILTDRADGDLQSVNVHAEVGLELEDAERDVVLGREGKGPRLGGRGGRKPAGEGDVSEVLRAADDRSLELDELLGRGCRGEQGACRAVDRSRLRDPSTNAKGWGCLYGFFDRPGGRLCRERRCAL